MLDLDGELKGIIAAIVARPDAKTGPRGTSE